MHGDSVRINTGVSVSHKQLRSITFMYGYLRERELASIFVDKILCIVSLKGPLLVFNMVMLFVYLHHLGLKKNGLLSLFWFENLAN